MMASHSPKRIRSAEKSCEDSKDKKEARMNAINNNVLRVSPRRQACQFAEWFRKLVDSDRSSLSLYLADDAILQWFGRTIKMKKRISGFLKYDMHCTSHRFTSVEVCSTFPVRGEKEEVVLERNHVAEEEKQEILATPLNSETPTGILNACLQRCSIPGLSVKRSRAISSSPESPTSTGYCAKKFRVSQSLSSPSVVSMEIDASTLICKKDNNVLKTNGDKEKTDDTTTILEEGQGDCLPSTSGSEPRWKRDNESKDDFFSQLPHSFVEARCVIEFTKTRDKRGANILKWERQCKLQVAYTEDPMYVGEYIIWTIVYSDNNKCRRNLLAAFDAVSKENH